MNQTEKLLEKVHTNLKVIMGNEFFAGLKSSPVNLRGYQLLVKQKYGGVTNFLDFLKRGEELSLLYSKEIEEVFRQNYLDEIGFFAGEVRDEYAHETWRQRSLKSFGISQKDFESIPLLSGVVQHAEMRRELIAKGTFLELVGALLFLEIFIVYEMKHLIEAFKRDLPELFPKDGYVHENFPLNTQEYWYNHALHDVWHFSQIKEGLQSYIEKANLDESHLNEIEKGIENVFQSKSFLYSNELLNEIKKAR
ncbi:MAG: hypothetical protein JWM20_543 [Patescibacteria group bacterium]|nr:hypothetical protein [Patescibacteria group bacterium]